MDAFRSGMLLLALGLLGSGLPAAAQTPAPPSADLQEKPAARQPADAPAPSSDSSPETVSAPAFSTLESAPPEKATRSRTHKSAKKGINFWSPEQELAMGRQLDEQMLSQVRLLEDPVVTGYLEDVTARIAANSEVEVPVVLRVVSSSQPDSFSLPGGYVYLTAGMVQETRTEAELAAVISHEVAHIARRHATRQMTKRQLMSLFAIPLMFVSGPVGFAIGETFSLAYPLTLLKFSRNAESEADAFGLRYMEASGYDPAASISLFERLASGENARMPGLRRLFSTHPITRDRLAAASKVIDKLPPRDEYVVSTSRYDEAVARLAILGYNHNPGIPALVRRTSRAPAEP